MKSTRALIAFAYVADRFAKTNDIAAGLVPLFAPLISARAGRPFDPQEFARDVKDTYDIDMHPYVAEEFAPALARGGFLEEIRRSDATVQYRNLECHIPDPPIREEQLRVLLEGFNAYSVAHLDKVGLTATGQQLDEAFLDRLIRPDFLALVLRPDVPSAGIRTLTLARPAAAADAALPRTEEHFDFLVASYILKLHDDDSEQFDLLVAATSGSLVSEVVLDLQHPPKQGEPLSGVEIAVDSPLILDALGLGLEGAVPYAKKLLEQIANAGAIPIVFDGTVEEIRRVLRAPLQNYERGLELYGPLGRRLRFSPALAPYIRAIIPNISSEIERLGVRVREITGAERAARRQFFTETMENELAGSVGDYPTEEARLHDARAISDVLRLRGQLKVTTIRDAKIVFVTRNSRLARLTRRHLSVNALMARDYFPPCITDRYLAGLLWISTGGGGESLSRLRLIANCSAAVVPRRDLVSRMHKFFEAVNPAMVKRFEALMTNERAEHFLMDRTLADSTLITQENFEEIYRDIEEVAAHRVTERKNEEIATLQESHAAQVEEMAKQHEERFLEQATLSATLETAVRNETARAERLDSERQEIATQLAATEERWAQACLRAGRRAARIAWGAIVLAMALVAAIVAVMSDDDVLQRAFIGGVTLVVALVASIIGNRFWRDNPIERWIDRRRDSAALNYARRHGVVNVLSAFELDWENDGVRRKEIV